MIGKGIGGKLWRVIKNIYEEVLSCVRLGNETTDWFSVEIGLRQGCILSPSLFSIFIDGLAEEVKKVGGATYQHLTLSLLLFAEDIVLMAEDARTLQRMLKVVHKYSVKFRFKFNQGKSNVMIFGSKKTGKDKFFLGKDELKVVEEYKYLGLVVDKDFSWRLHLSKVIEKASKRMRALCGMGIGQGISVRALMRGWEVLVRPLLEYGAEIWGDKVWREGEALQLEMGRRVLGVSKNTTREVVRGELGLSRIRSRRTLLRLKFWVKLLRMEESRLVRKIYERRRREFEEGGRRDKKNWCYWTWISLKELGMENIWESENFGNPNAFNRMLRTSIQNLEEKFWEEEMKKKPKLRLYRQIKSSLRIEEYLFDHTRGSRIQFTLLRGEQISEGRDRKVGREKIEERVSCLSTGGNSRR